MKLRLLTIILLALSFTAKASEEILLVDTVQQFMDTTIVVEDTIVVTQPAPEQLRYLEILKAQPEIKTANFSKMSFAVTMSGTTRNARGSIKLVTDSAMQISIQFMGMEVFKVDITPDSAWLFNRFNRTCAIIHHSAALPSLFYNAQATFLNHLYTFGERNMPQSFTGKIIEAEMPDGISNLMPDIALNFTDEAGLAEHFFWINPDNRITGLRANLLDAGFICEYSAFNHYGEIYYPSSLAMDLTIVNDIYKIKIDVNNAEFNQPLTIRRTNVGNFKIVHIDNMMKLLDVVF